MTTAETSASVMTGVKDIADDVVAMSRAGNVEGIGPKYWADTIVSIEAMDGPMARIEGTDAVSAKGEWWSGAHEIHGAETYGPWVNGDQFSVRWVMDVTQKESGNRLTIDEIALYTVSDGKIVEEKFFY